MRPRRHAQEAEGVSSRRKQKQERKRERERVSFTVPQGVTIAPAVTFDREALLKEPGAVEYRACAGCERGFELEDALDASTLCAACFIAAAPDDFGH